MLYVTEEHWDLKEPAPVIIHKHNPKIVFVIVLILIAGDTVHDHSTDGTISAMSVANRWTGQRKRSGRS